MSEAIKLVMRHKTAEGRYIELEVPAHKMKNGTIYIGADVAMWGAMYLSNKEKEAVVLADSPVAGHA
jgi:hypothetical protein